MRALLYWDQVGTIVPESWVHSPELLGDHTLELVQRGLLLQVFPWQVGQRHRDRFGAWLDRLGEDELAARRQRLASGRIARVHEDKWLAYASGLHAALELGLAGRSDGEWVELEESTAGEFMASLALDLCHPESDLSRPADDRPQTWIPATGDENAFKGLLGGLVPQGDSDGAERALTLRVRGEARVCDLRAMVLERALPVPEETPTPLQLEQFKRKHGNRLPRLRRHIEALIDSRLASDDEVLVFRAVDRLAEQIEEATGEAEQYLKEAGLRRVHRSPLTRILKTVPVASAPAAAAQEVAQSLQTATDLETDPLAYFAFARTELRLVPRYTLSPRHAALVEAFA